MRIITDYKVNPCNDTLTVSVLDEPGAGGASHLYRVISAEADPVITGGEATKEQVAAMDRIARCRHNIRFQDGPIAEAGVNGITQEVLLAIVADRLRSFQAGPYACRENACALTKVEEAMMWLQKRTLDRMRRGVEGTHAK